MAARGGKLERDLTKGAAQVDVTHELRAAGSTCKSTTFCTGKPLSELIQLGTG